MSTSTGELRRRPGTSADREFLYQLIRLALGPHVEATYGAWDEAWQRRNFVETTDPVAHEILELDGVAIGCLLLEALDQSLELHRLLLLPEHQGKGIGSRLMRDLQDEAARLGKPITLQVFRVSPALRFYERLGFERRGESETHVQMRWG